MIFGMCSNAYFYVNTETPKRLHWTSEYILKYKCRPAGGTVSDVIAGQTRKVQVLYIMELDRKIQVM